MKFTEFPYVRPDLTAAMAKLDELAKTIREAQDAAAAKDAFLAYEEIAKEVGSAHAISSVRHTVNTKDAFYNEENAFWDENSPILNDKYLDIYRAMVSSPLRPELEEALGKLLFTKMEIDVKSADPSIIPLMQEENALCTEYENLYASAQIPFDGKILTVAQLGPYKQSADRTVRKAAFIPYSVASVKIKLLLAGHERKCLVKVCHKLLGRCCLTGIVTRSLDTAGETLLTVEAYNVVTLPAMYGNRNVLKSV